MSQTVLVPFSQAILSFSKRLYQNQNRNIKSRYIPRKIGVNRAEKYNRSKRTKLVGLLKVNLASKMIAKLSFQFNLEFTDSNRITLLVFSHVGYIH